MVVTDILEADVNGCLPGDEAYNPNKGVSLLQYLSNRPPLVSLQLIAQVSTTKAVCASDYSCTELLQFFKLAKHPTLKCFIESQWWKHGMEIFW